MGEGGDTRRVGRRDQRRVSTGKLIEANQNRQTATDCQEVIRDRLEHPVRPANEASARPQTLSLALNGKKQHCSSRG